MTTLQHFGIASNPGSLGATLEVDLFADYAPPIDPLTYEPTATELAELAELEASPAVAFESWLKDQAIAYRAHRTENADWVAGLFERLASLASYTEAKSCEQLGDRMMTLDIERAYRIVPAESMGRAYPGWDLRSADDRLVGYFPTIDAARLALEELRAMKAVA